MKRVVVVGTGSQPESCLGEAAGGLGDGAGAMKEVRKGGNTQVPCLGTTQIEPPFAEQTPQGVSGPWDRLPRGSSLRTERWPSQGSWTLASKWTTQWGWLGSEGGHSSIPPPSGGLGGQVLLKLLGPAIQSQPLGHCARYSFLSNRLASWGTDFYPRSQTNHPL